MLPWTCQGNGRWQPAKLKCSCSAMPSHGCHLAGGWPASWHHWSVTTTRCGRITSRWGTRWGLHSMWVHYVLSVVCPAFSIKAVVHHMHAEHHIIAGGDQGHNPQLVFGVQGCYHQLVSPLTSDQVHLWYLLHLSLPAWKHRERCAYTASPPASCNLLALPHSLSSGCCPCCGVWQMVCHCSSGCQAPQDQTSARCCRGVLPTGTPVRPYTAKHRSTSRCVSCPP